MHDTKRFDSQAAMRAIVGENGHESTRARGIRSFRLMKHSVLALLRAGTATLQHCDTAGL